MRTKPKPHQFAVETLEKRIVLNADLPLPDFDLPHEQEPNDTIDTANPIKLHSVCRSFSCFGFETSDERVGLVGHMTGQLTPDDDGDVDYFSLRIPEATVFHIGIRGPDLKRAGEIRLLNADGELVATGEHLDANRGIRIKAESRFGGTFYLEVPLANDDSHEIIETASGETVRPVEPDVSSDDETTDGGKSDDGIIEIHPGYRIAVEADHNPYVEFEPNNDFESSNPILLTPTRPFFSDAAGFPSILPPNKSLSGRIEGELNSGLLTVLDEDFFDIKVPQNQIVQVHVSGHVLDHRGELRLYDSDQNLVAEDIDASNGLAVKLKTEEGGVFFLRINQSTSDTPIEPQPTTETIGESSQLLELEKRVEPRPDHRLGYRIGVHSTRLLTDIEGPDEHEPNGTIDTADVLKLHDLPTFAPGIGLRGGRARGITSSQDVDIFEIDVRAGEHVRAGVWQIPRLERGPIPLPGFWAHGIHAVLLNADGEVIQRNEHGGFFEFKSEVDTVFYVSITGHKSIALNAIPDSPLDYVVGALARRRIEKPVPEPEVKPVRVELGPGDKHEFVNANGDMVELEFKGKRGLVRAVIGGSDKGSDMRRVVVLGAHPRDRLIVRADGETSVDAIHVRGARRFGRIDFDGDVGSLASRAHLTTVVIDGVLGEIHAGNRTVKRLFADYYDESYGELKDISAVRLADSVEQFVIDIADRYGEFMDDDDGEPVHKGLDELTEL